MGRTLRVAWLHRMLLSHCARAVAAGSDALGGAAYVHGRQRANVASPSWYALLARRKAGATHLIGGLGGTKMPTTRDFGTFTGGDVRSYSTGRRRRRRRG